MDSTKALSRMHEPFFTYRADAEDVLAGDLLELAIDCGFGITHHTRVAVHGVDAHDPSDPSSDEETFKRGRAEAAFVSNWLEATHRDNPEDRWPLVAMTSVAPSGVDREYSAKIFRKDTGKSLTDDLLRKFPDIAQ